MRLRLSAAHAILQSRVGRQLLAVFFVLVAVPVGVVSVLAYQLTDYVVRRSGAQLSGELGKAVGINLMDRMRAGEALLRMHAQAAAAQTRIERSPALDERLSEVFSDVLIRPASGPAQGLNDRSSLRVIPAGPGRREAPEIELTVPVEGATVRGRFQADYLWENAQSGTHRICFSGGQMAQPFCQGPQVAGKKMIHTQRELFFQPYFDAPNWTIATAFEPDVGYFLPVGMAALVGNVAAIALLLAAAGSSVMLRRLTRPLDALALGTKAVLRGDFSQQVTIEGKRSEFTDLADSFNAMALEVGRDLRLFRVLARMDQAIIEQRPFAEVAQLMLEHLNAPPMPGQVSIVVWATGESGLQVLALAPDGSLQRADVDVSRAGGPWNDLAVAQTAKQRVWLRLAAPGAAEGRAGRELDAFRQRLAVALHAQQHEQQLRERATRDSLTGLLNRFGLIEAVDALTRAAVDPGALWASFAVVCMDLDGFKEINDAHGHDVGDAVLREVAVRLRQASQGHALVLARPGGDEFVFVLPADGPAAPQECIAAVLHAVRQPYSVPPHTLQLGASLGLARFPEHGASRDELLRHADQAMYSAKGSGRNMVAEFEPALAAQLAAQQELRQDLRHALARGQMFVVFQPRVSASDRSMVSAEALLRWRHPERGMVPPDVFIALAEESGFILELGLWVLRQALAQYVIWRTLQHSPIRQLSVNLSPVQLADPAFPQALRALMQEFEVQPGELELEVTEGVLIQDVDAAVTRLAALRGQGVSIALDDFGVGYSAMRYLSRLPFDTLKIDKSFVSAFGNERPALAIASAIVALAKALDKRVVAEGVEMPMQADLLQGLGVHELQGYLYGRPQSPAELESCWRKADAGGPLLHDL